MLNCIVAPCYSTFWEIYVFGQVRLRLRQLQSHCSRDLTDRCYNNASVLFLPIRDGKAECRPYCNIART